MTFEDGINVPLRHDYTNKVIGVKSNPDPSSMTPSNGAYFSAPALFLGDQRASYNQELGFKLKIIDQGPVATQEDIVITGKEVQIVYRLFLANCYLPTRLPSQPARNLGG